MSDTPTENLNDPDGPGWRTLGEREVLQPGDMWRDLEGNWRETNYGNDNVLAGNTAADYYRRCVDIPPGPNWRRLADDEAVKEGDMYQAKNGQWVQKIYPGGGKRQGGYYRRIDTAPSQPEPPKQEPEQLPEVSTMEQMTKSVNDRLEFLEKDWAVCTNLCSCEDVEGRKALMRNIMSGGMTYLQDSITAWAIRKGWLTETPRNPAEQLMLIVTELAEACEAFRMGNPPCERPGMEQYSHAAEELADVVIRCLQMAGEHNIPLADVVMAKMAFNETRPVKHGKKF